MPTYIQALASKPKKIDDFGDAVKKAQDDVKDTESDYRKVAKDLKRTWTGDASDKFQQAAHNSNRTIGQIANQLGNTQIAADVGSMQMHATVQMISNVKRTAETAGYVVTPAPMAIIGPRQQAQIAAATLPPAQAALIAGFQVGALMINGQLYAMITMLTMEDVGTAARIHMSAVVMRTLAVTLGGGNKALLPPRKLKDDPYKRGNFWKKTKTDAWDRSRDQTADRQRRDGRPVDGLVYDPNDANYDRGDLEYRPSDVGHPAGWEFRDQAAAGRLWGVDRNSFNRDYNHPDFIMEGRPENRSHQFEADDPNRVSSWVPYHYGRYGEPPAPTVSNINYNQLRLGNA
ncbi:GH-E family nuclease [Glycomyces buryatensis]|uniref:Toxin YqcG C-terminal domain-containing protein n=1 Tax=Glycomyces buryatensis TaxID=2570927 RepID=A0A4S8QAF3_9ACTN|nr:WXG100 family type VII secretion target [Glycomyces buryatensis]THV41427.1 hypothetical protein FAB82_11555 [Glycomyces buryatensis]